MIEKVAPPTEEEIARMRKKWIERFPELQRWFSPPYDDPFKRSAPRQAPLSERLHFSPLFTLLANRKGPKR